MNIALKVIIALASAFVSVCAYAADTQCTDNQHIVYVNGIQNDYAGAQETANAIRDTLIASPMHSNAKQSFSVTSRLNPAGFTSDGGSAMLLQFRDDERKLFLAKTTEELYLTNLNRLVSPYNSPIPVNMGAAQSVKPYSQHLLVGRSGYDSRTQGDYQYGDNYLTATNEVTEAGMAYTQDNLDGIVNDIENCAGKTVVVGHSLGNFYATLAYVRAAADGVDVNSKVRVINLANTMNVSINGLELTHSGDVILSRNLKNLATDGANWWRFTNGCLSTVPDNQYCEFTSTPATFDGPPMWKQDGTVNDTCWLNQNVWNPLSDAATFLERFGEVICEHGATSTYLSSKEVSPKSSYSVPGKTGSEKTFAHYFEDLVYAASKSIDDYVIAKTPPPSPPPPAPVVQDYIRTDFSSSVPNMYTWGSPYPLYDTNSQSYMVAGTGGFGVGLPPDLNVIEITARVMFIAADNQPNQFSLGLWSNNPGVSDAVYIDFLHNAGICNTNGYGTLSMSGDPSPWQCRDDLHIDTNQLINYGWVEIYARYDRTQCTLTVSARRLDGGYGTGTTVPLHGTQCSNARGAFAFTPGSPSNTALMLFNYLQVTTTK